MQNDYDIFDEGTLNEKTTGNARQLLPTVIEIAQEEQADKRKGIRHSVVFPPSIQPPKDPKDPIFTLEKPVKMAREYPFELDPFQIKAIGALERGESVLVSAHTSAGKTVIAEYAIALCLQRGQKIVYTSPIKALSNQKYRDLTVTYTENKQLVNNVEATIGLMTGDTTLKRNAQVLVMTTEILRNMLHSGAELLREIGCVIFDEVHYMRNLERGLVWEDCLSLLDSKITFVFLSATIPNANEFAAWVCQTHQKPVHVVYTEYRPVPLQFFISPIGSQQAFQVFTSDNRVIQTEQVNKALQALPFQAHVDTKMSVGKQKKQKTTDTVVAMLRMLIQKNIYPVIIFSFGKTKCEEYAILASKVPNFANLLTQLQRDTVAQLYDAALQELPAEDRTIKQIVAAKELLMKGIAVHHSGLLPFVKEITEILFQEDLVKMIFVTETFSMGLNLPARCVLFTELMKFDGQEQRYVQSGEFIQMAGRSGRRGKDTQGVVISLFADQEQCQEVLNIMQGTAEPLNSAYRLNYGSIINLIRTEGISPEYAISKSFLQFQKTFRLPRCERELENVNFKMEYLDQQFIQSFPTMSSEKFIKYLELEQIAAEQWNQYQSMIEANCDLQKILIPGRIIEVQAEGQYYSWGVVISTIRFSGKGYVDVLVPVQTRINLEKAGSEPTLTLLNQTKTDQDQDLVAGILLNSAFDSFVSKNVKQDQIVSPNLEEIIFQKRNQEVSEHDLRKFEHWGNQPYIQKASAQDGVTRMNDVITYAIIQLMRHEEHLKASASVRERLQQIDLVHLAREPFTPCIIRISYAGIKNISSKFLKQLPTSFQHFNDRQQVMTNFATAIETLAKQALQKVIEEKPDLRGISLVDCLSDRRQQIIPIMQFDQIEGVGEPLQQQQKRLSQLEDLMHTEYADVHSFYSKIWNPDLMQVQPVLLNMLKQKKNKVILENALRNSQMVLQAELAHMRVVLEELDYIKGTQILEKGKIACQINAASELVLTECVFQNAFAGATPEQFAGIICSIIGEGGVDEYNMQNEDLQRYVGCMGEVVKNLIKVCAAHDTKIDQNITKVEDLVDGLSAEVAFEWAKGASLNSVIELDKNLFEGNVVRMLRRLVNLLVQIEEAVQGWGGGEIQALCQQAIQKVNRGIVKADSLYIVEEQDGL